MRILVISAAAVFLSYFSGILLALLFMPEAVHVAHLVFTTPQQSPEWNELWRQWHREQILTIYVVNPIVGLIVGTFVGFLERNRIVLVAGTALIPRFLQVFMGDHAKAWANSPVGILVYFADSSLPFIAAIGVAIVVHHWRTRVESRRRLVQM